MQTMSKSGREGGCPPSGAGSGREAAQLQPSLRPQEVLEADQLSWPRGEPFPNGAAIGGHELRPSAEGLPAALLASGMTSPSPKADPGPIVVIVI